MDQVRVVTFSPGGQIVELLMLQDGLSYGFERETLGFVAPERAQRMAKSNRRYGGARYAGESHDNGIFKVNILAMGATADSLLTKFSNLIAQCERVPGTHYIEFKMEGATYPSYYEVRAPAKRTPDYKWGQATNTGSNSMILSVEWPVAPLVRGAPMNVFDDFDTASLTDYTVDAGALADLTCGVGIGALIGTASLSAEKRLVHTIRGYTYGSQQVTVEATPNTTITNFKAGAVVKRVAADSYVEGYVHDDGVSSRLRIDTVNAGVRTNRFTVNLAARIVVGTKFYVRCRIEYDTVSVEYFTTPPTPMSTPVSSGSYGLAGGDAALMGSGIPGVGGLSFIPITAGANIGSIDIKPYVFHNKTLPDHWPLDGVIPGDAPALGTFQICHSGGASIPVFACLSWIGRDKAGDSPGPFGIFESGNVIASSGMSYNVTGSARGGSEYLASPVAGGEYIEWTSDFRRLFSDDESSDSMSTEVWARVKLSASAAGLKVAAYVKDSAAIGGNGLNRYTIEHGAAGKTLIGPFAGTQYRYVRLGTIQIRKPAPGNMLSPRIGLSISGGVGGTFALDYLMINPASRRACSPTGKILAAGGYPSFTPSTTPILKTIGSDLSGLISTGPDGGSYTFGLGGSLIELPAGIVDISVKLSTNVPDDPNAHSLDEQLAHSATVALGIVPRWQYQRPA